MTDIQKNPEPVENSGPILSGSALELSRWMRDRTSTPFSLTFTRNRSTLASIREKRDGLFAIRMHYSYGRAPASVLLALIRYIDHRKTADWNKVREYADSISSPGSPVRSASLQAEGQEYNLTTLLDRVNELHFKGQVQCDITWGRHGTRKKRKRRSIRYGSYDRDRRLITIHPALDSANIPEAFVQYIVFHEMLHDRIPAERVNGRMYHHPPAYRAREKQYPDYEKMKKLAGQFLQKL